MTQRVLIRQLRKQSVQLRAQRHRLSLREDLRGLHAPFSSGEEGAGGIPWLAISGSLLNVVAAGKTGRWGRVLSIGMLSWRLVKGVLAQPKPPKSGLPDKA